VVVHPRTDRMRKIVVESGRDGLRQWRRYRRALAADYRLAFGEAPGPLLAVAVMTDGDNTRSRLLTRYRDISWS
jgi:head-tail adaptor